MMNEKIHWLNVAIITLSVLFIMIFFWSVGNLIENESYYTDKDRVLLSYLEEEEYSELIENISVKKYRKPSRSQTYEELCAVAGYFEAASLYHAYHEIGNTERAEQLLREMDTNSALMGELSYTKKEIDRRLGIE